MKSKIFASLTFLGSLAGYVANFSQGVHLEDSAEFVSAVAVLGVPHPSGYPVYVMLGKLFAWISPFGISFDLKLFSAITAALAVMFVFLFFLELSKFLRFDLKNTVFAGAFLFAMVFAFGRDFFSQSIVAEVYSLHLSFVSLSLFLLFRWLNTKSQKILFSLAFLGGFSLGNHLLYLFVLPSIWLAIWYKSNSQLDRKTGLILFGCFIFGLFSYLYLPIRVVAEPILNFGNLQNFTDTISHILRVNYQDIGFSLTSSFEFIVSYIDLLLANVPAGLVFFAILGMIVLLVKRRFAFLLWMIGSFGLVTFLPVFLRSLDFTPVTDFIYRVYYLPSYIFILALGFLVFLWVSQRWQYWLLLLLGMLSLGTFYTNSTLVTIPDHQIEKYYTEKLNLFLPDSVYLLVSEGYDYDSELFVLFYLQNVKGVRRDVTVVTPFDLFQNSFVDPIQSSDLADLRKKYLQKVLANLESRPFYTSFPIEKYIQGYKSFPNGLAVRVLPEGEATSGYVGREDLAISSRAGWDLAYRDFLAQVALQDSLLHLINQEFEQSHSGFVFSIVYDNEVNSEDQKAFRAFRAKFTNDGQ